MKPRGCWWALYLSALGWLLLALAAWALWLLTRWWLLIVLVWVLALAQGK